MKLIVDLPIVLEDHLLKTKKEYKNLKERRFKIYLSKRTRKSRLSI